MKRIFIFTLLLLALSILQDQPVIEFETLKHDFGEIKEEDGPHEFNFDFMNEMALKRSIICTRV